MSKKKEILKIRNLNVEYPLFGGILQREVSCVHAVKNLSIDIAEGETVGIVGESGSGKSTLGKAILNVLNLTAPDVRITGEVLLNVQTRKTILSYGSGGDVFRFIEEGTQLVEIEDGVGNNESVTYATRSAIEAGVLELIYQGHDRGYWIIEEGHRHPHNSDGTNDKHAVDAWYEEVEKITGEELEPFEELEENEETN